MKLAAGRLIVTAVLFVGWLGYLNYLVWTRPEVVLSRPQALISNLDVIAHVEALDQSAVVREALYQTSKTSMKPGDKIVVRNLTERGCEGFEGPGDYLLLLTPTRNEGQFEVVPTPPSPGFVSGPAWIYPADKVLAQYREVKKPKAP